MMQANSKKNPNKAKAKKKKQAKAKVYKPRVFKPPDPNEWQHIDKHFAKDRKVSLNDLVRHFMPVKVAKRPRLVLKSVPLPVYHRSRYMTLSLEQKKAIVFARYGAVGLGLQPLYSFKEIADSFRIAYSTVERTIKDFLKRDGQIVVFKRGTKPSTVPEAI